jgi:hypothetical protein
MVKSNSYPTFLEYIDDAVDWDFKVVKKKIRENFPKNRLVTDYRYLSTNKKSFYI